MPVCCAAWKGWTDGGGGGGLVSTEIVYMIQVHGGGRVL